jgi:hypothetical protein
LPYHPFFDNEQYPWGRDDAIALHQALYRVIDHPSEISLVYRQSAGTRPLTPALAAHLAWTEVLDNLARERCLSKLCTLVLDRTHYASAHAAVAAVRDAKDLLPQIVLPYDILFLDRKELRAELEKLSQPGASGVLLVRGPSGAGKSWTQEMIKIIAGDRGVGIVYLYEGIVSNVREVIDQLFTALGDSRRVPPTNETDPAWYRLVCLKLQELAQQKGRFLWVVADDLGEYPEGPRVDREIRAFFHQFGMNLANPAFARCFRMVLLDYPEGPVPTKWRAWSEDRPNENDIENTTIAEFLLEWAEHKKKQLGVDRAQELASGILVKAAGPPAPTDRDPRRLGRIHSELAAVLKTL